MNNKPSDLYQKTLAYIVKVHNGQDRKNGIPYVCHPIDVFKKLSNWGITNPDVLTAALAHDVLEDCDISEKELRFEIGDKATEIVKELTYIYYAESRDENTTSQSKEQYMESFKDKSTEALVIKIADRICNTHDFMSQDRLSKTKKPYANKYWKKAEKLFFEFTRRKHELKDVAEQIIGEINFVDQKLLENNFM